MNIGPNDEPEGARRAPLPEMLLLSAKTTLMGQPLDICRAHGYPTRQGGLPSGRSLMQPTPTLTGGLPVIRIVQRVLLYSEKDTRRNSGLRANHLQQFRTDIIVPV